MEASAHLAVLRTDVERFLSLLDGDLTRQVPTCPDWTVADLAAHLGVTYRYVLLQIDAGPGGDLAVPNIVPPGPGPDLVPWVTEGTQQLIAALEDLDPSEHRPNWAGRPTAAFYFRRMAHETSIHRFDGESAFDATTPIDRDLAVDGVDEIFDTFAPLGRVPELDGTSVHLHYTDGEGEWLVSSADGGVVTMSHEHAKGDVAVRGSASDLVLFLWHRHAPSDLEVFGDHDVLHRWHAHTAIG